MALLSSCLAKWEPQQQGRQGAKIVRRAIHVKEKEEKEMKEEEEEREKEGCKLQW
jgi:hypothetical protein